VFLKVYTELEQRIRIFTALQIETLERFALERRVAEIGSGSVIAGQTEESQPCL
jgi:hypothetical protein